MNPIASYKINGLPFISGNALASSSLTPLEVFKAEYPGIPDGIAAKRYWHPVNAPFGGHIMTFTTNEAEVWFRLKYG